jgi:hypothetical protein
MTPYDAVADWPSHRRWGMSGRQLLSSHLQWSGITVLLTALFEPPTDGDYLDEMALDSGSDGVFHPLTVICRLANLSR